MPLQKGRVELYTHMLGESVLCCSAATGTASVIPLFQLLIFSVADRFVCCTHGRTSSRTSVDIAYVRMQRARVA